MKLSFLHRTNVELTLHDIHGLDEKGADERQNKREIFKSCIDGQDKSDGRDKEEDPIKPSVFLLLFHSQDFVMDPRPGLVKLFTKLREKPQKEKSMKPKVV